MKRIIYEPDTDEFVPEGGVFYHLPIMNKDVVDIIVDDDFTTTGTVYDDFTTTGTVYYDSVSNPTLSEPFVHHFAGWEPVV